MRGKGEGGGGEGRLYLSSCDVAVPKAIIRKEKGIETNLKRRGGERERYAMTPRSVDEMASGPRKREGGGGRNLPRGRRGRGRKNVL